MSKVWPQRTDDLAQFDAMCTANPEAWERLATPALHASLLRIRLHLFLAGDRPMPNHPPTPPLDEKALKAAFEARARTDSLADAIEAYLAAMPRETPAPTRCGCEVRWANGGDEVHAKGCPAAPTPTRAAVEEALNEYAKRVEEYVTDAQGESDGDEMLSAYRTLLALFDAPPRGEAVEAMERPDILLSDDAMWSVINEVFCRVYGDEYEAMREVWREWYQPEQWFWWGRALGAFMSSHPALPVPPAGTREAVETAARLLIVAWSEKMASTSSVDEIAEIQVREAEKYRAAANALLAALPVPREGEAGTPMRRFTVYRRGDLSATHNDQQAAAPDAPQYEGVVFSDGRVALRWLTPLRSVSVWDSLDDALGVHGHPEPRYGTEFVWHDAAVASLTASEGQT